MATEVFKDGKSYLIDPESVFPHLAAGYTLEPEAPKAEVAPVNVPEMPIEELETNVDLADLVIDTSDEEAPLVPPMDDMGADAPEKRKPGRPKKGA